MAGRRILFLTTHSSKGGTLDYIFALKRKFDADGYETSIVALTRGIDHDPRPQIEVLASEGKNGALPCLVAVLRFLTLCLKSRPTLIVGVMPLANIVAAMGSVVARCKMAATHHNPHPTHGKLARILDKLVGLAGFYDRVFCVSRSVARSFENHPRRYRRLIRIVLNGVPPLAASSLSKAQARQRFDLAPDRPIVLMVGRLSAEKNVRGVIEAIGDVDGVQLVLAGDGQLRSELEARVRDRGLSGKVKFLGSVRKPDVADLLHASDVFVQVSFYEGNSLALLEAISAQSTIVVSEVPAQREAVTLADGSPAAIFCRPDDHRDIARAIGQAVFDEKLRQQLARNVEELARRFRTEDDMLADYALELESLLSPVPATLATDVSESSR